MRPVGSVAQALTRIMQTADAPVALKAYDGSTAGPADSGVTISINSPTALSYLVTAPGELGLARAYVSGELEVEGDVYQALRALSMVKFGRISTAEKVRLIRELGGIKLLRRPPVPPQEAKLRGRRHSKERDQEAISHHYDVSNQFYEWLLGPSMAYTCAVFQTPDSTLEQAQFAKHDLVARKLGLKEGMRLLDVGCGWGGMTIHAAKHYGVRTLGVTLSRKQAEWAAKAIAQAGLSEVAEVRHLDYRDVPEGDFDAISSIGLTEHIGEAQLPGYFQFLFDKLRPGGRLLNHCITRPDNRRRAKAGHFIGRYVFPDGELAGPGHLVSLIHDTGFEVRHSENLREHYAKTLAGWSNNLDAHWDEAVKEIGLGRARVWRLYLAGSRLGFDENGIQLHQILATKNRDHGQSDMPLRPNWEPPTP